MKFITEVSDTAYFLIKNPLIKNSNKTNVLLKGEEDMNLTLVANLCEKKNSVHKAMKSMTTTSLCLIIFQPQILVNTTQHTRVGFGMVLIGEKYQDTFMI